MNVALKKPVLEPSVFRPEAATDGITTGYSGQEGFAHFGWPGTCTVDLEEAYELKCIRFLLWDGLGKGGVQPAPRRYLYRLLTSVDQRTWTVQYETNMDGSIGWQVFDFGSPINARYVRIHGLWNSAKPNMHVVEIEAHTVEPPPTNWSPNTLVRFDQPNDVSESQTTLPTAKKMGSIIHSLREIVEKHRDTINTERLQAAIGDLEVQMDDVGRVEASIDSVKRLIVLPVADELHFGRRAGVFSIRGFWMGLAGIVISVVLFALSLILGHS